MINKTLRRILTKTLNVNSYEELATVLEGFEGRVTDAELNQQFKGFRENLADFIGAVDKAVSDLDRVIDIRDRSLSISSKEMVAINEQISAEAERQRVVLDQLQHTLRLLQVDRTNVAEAEDNDLGHLVQKVSVLTERQLNSARDLKALFVEGLHISSVMSFKSLEAQLGESISGIVGISLELTIYFASHLIGQNKDSLYFSCDQNNQPLEPLDISQIKMSESDHYMTINSTKGDGILAFVRVHFSISQPLPILDRIQPLLPNVAATIENIRLLQEEKHKQHLESELLTARFVQQALLPPTSPTVTDGSLEVSGHYQSASECGGDWWTYFRVVDGQHIFLVGDVTGHGTGSAMVCAVVKGYCESLVGRRDIGPSKILAELNSVIFQIARQVGRAMTMAAISIDLAQAKVTFANAGHPHPILMRSPSPGAKQLSTQYLVNSGSILGLDSEAIFAEKVFSFLPGNQLVLYSDGVTEYVNKNREVYGDQRLLRLLTAHTSIGSAAELNRRIVRDLQEFALGEPPLDDITTVIIKGKELLSAEL